VGHVFDFFRTYGEAQMRRPERKGSHKKFREVRVKFLGEAKPLPLAGRPGCATLLEEKKDPLLNHAIRSCEGILLKHNVRYENNKHNVDYKSNANKTNTRLL